MSIREVVRCQTKAFLQSKSAVAVWIILLCVTSLNFISNCIYNVKIHYVTEMYDPIKTLTLSGWSNAGNIFMYAYPLILVLPTAMVYYDERINGISRYIQSRSGFKKYYYGNAIAVVIVTFFLFTVPFLLELLLSTVCFSNHSVADPSGIPLYVTLPEEKKNLLYQVYIVSPYLYGFLMTIRFGLISCVFAFFNYAFSTSPKIKYKMITMIPLLGTLYFLMIIDSFVPAKLSYLMFMPMFEYRNVSEGFYLAGYIGMLAIAILELIINEKRYYSLQG